MTDVLTDILVCATGTQLGIVELLRLGGTVWTTFVLVTAILYELCDGCRSRSRLPVEGNLLLYAIHSPLGVGAEDWALGPNTTP